ncbi:MAG: isoprenylcysteine carboxylmethyltransferase family protein [Anaerolineaceae bacterium]|nr:isoprenylcysteine carboxylmethyltransferase family protein [Anaerolineaceae bacterium]
MAKQPWWKGAKGEWYVAIQVLLFGLVAFGPAALPGWPAWSGTWRTVSLVVGLLLGGIGGLLAFAGVFSLGRNLTAVPHPKEDAHMVAHGAYRFVRHPIYSGIILGAFGLGFLRGGWLSLLYALILFIFFDIKSRREEMWLRAKYVDYADYQQRVHKLIPFVY